jgi:deoxycytidine triphosphate deaminase
MGVFMQAGSETRGHSYESNKLTPTQVMKIEMDRHGWKHHEFAEKLNVKPQTLYNLTGSQPRKISTKLAAALSNLLGGDLEFWLSDFVDADYKLKKMAGHGVYAALIDDPDKTIKMAANQVGILSDDSLHYFFGLENGPIAITPYEKSLVKPASVDLRLGFIISEGFTALFRTDWVKIATYKINKNLLDVDDQIHVELLLEDYVNGEKLSEGEEYDYVVTEEIVIEPNQTVFALTLEHLRLSRDFIARVGPTATNSLMGVHVGYGFQVDPGYEGPLVVRIDNLNTDKITLKREMILLSVEFTRLPNPARKRHSIGDIDHIAYAIGNYRKATLECFSYDYGPNGKPISISLKGARPLFLNGEFDSFEQMAIDWFITGLRVRDDPDHQIIVGAMENAMMHVVMDGESVNAWGASLRLHPDQALDLAKLFGENKVATLWDVVQKLGGNPRALAIELLREGSKSRISQFE